MADSAVPPISIDVGRALQCARDVLGIEADAINRLSNSLDHSFVEVMAVIQQCSGTVFFAGLGKSGQVARKAAATFASTGTPATFLHATEALHGDLGSIRERDILLLLSHSGSGSEVVTIARACRARGCHTVAVTGDGESELASACDSTLHYAFDREACPHNLAPTASTTVATALLDAMALTLSQARGFQPSDFAASHPAGKLGRRLLVRVADVMTAWEQVPKVNKDTPVAQALAEMSRAGMGLLMVVEAGGTNCGIVTDGDLRRATHKGLDLRDTTAATIMTSDYKTIDFEALLVDAASLMEEYRIYSLVATDSESGEACGIVTMHQIVAAQVL